MLDGYGLHQLTWDTCDERFGDVLVASPADARGRGTEPFTAVNTAGGTFAVYYPAAMQEAVGAVRAQVMVLRDDDTYISSRVFTIRVEPVIVGGGEHGDGFTLRRGYQRLRARDRDHDRCGDGCEQRGEQCQCSGRKYRDCNPARRLRRRGRV